jgi:hypothetical protein
MFKETTKMNLDSTKPDSLVELKIAKEITLEASFKTEMVTTHLRPLLHSSEMPELEETASTD